MQDTIILGNGTSKQIKTASLPNSYAEFKAMAENGNLFADIKLNANGCEVVGTPLNKLNLLTDETAGKIGNPQNIDEAINKLHSTINGIPVDLTGIYNTQVIGYDEMQGKLVPMINVARTETVLPTTETPQPWTIEGSGNWTISSTGAYPSAGGTWAGTLGETLNVIAVSTRPYLLSEFTTLSATMDASASYSRFDFTSKLQLSKTQDFSIIDAEMAGTSTLDITALKGYYYWRWIVDGVCTMATSDGQATVSASISKLSFS